MSIFEKINQVRRTDPYITEKLKIALAECIYEAIQDSNESQKDISERAGVSQQHLSRILHVDANPTVETISKLAHALDREVSLLFHRREEQALLRQRVSFGVDETCGSKVVPIRPSRIIRQDTQSQKARAFETLKAN